MECRFLTDNYINAVIFRLLYIGDRDTLWGIFAKIWADYFIYLLLLLLGLYGIFLIFKVFKDKLYKHYKLNTLKGIYLLSANLIKDPIYGVWLTTTVSLFVSYFLKEFIQFIYFNPRPEFVLHITPIVESKHSPSFPSGHTIVMMSISWSIYQFVMNMECIKDGKYKIIASVLLILTMFSAMCRICVGIHWPFDILGGIIISYIVTYIVLMLYNKIINAKNTIKRINGVE